MLVVVEETGNVYVLLDPLNTNSIESWKQLGSSTERSDKWALWKQ